MCIWPTCYIHVCNCQGLFEPQQDPAPVILDLPPTCHNEKKKKKVSGTTRSLCSWIYNFTNTITLTHNFIYVAQIHNTHLCLTHLK